MSRPWGVAPDRERVTAVAWWRCLQQGRSSCPAPGGANHTSLPDDRPQGVNKAQGVNKESDMNWTWNIRTRDGG